MNAAAAMEENLAELICAIGATSPRYELYAGDDLVWLLSDIRFPLFNSVIRARGNDALPAAVAGAVERGRARHVPLLWWVCPQTAPENLASELAAHGFTKHGDQPGMSIDLGRFEPRPGVPDLAIERVADPAAAATWCRVVCDGFVMPSFVADAFLEFVCGIGFATSAPLQNYLGWWNGEPVATSTLFLGGGVAGIYDVATLPAARRRGIGAAMTQHTLLDGRAAGAMTGVLQASDMGVEVYRSLGFVEECRFETHVWSG